MPSRMNHLKELLAAATPGPWPVGYLYWSFRQVEKSCCEGVYQHMDGTEISDEESDRCPGKEDAPFIAAAVNALPDLLALVEAAQAMMRDHHPYAGREGRVCIDVPVGAFCEFASKLAHLAHSPCDEVQP